MLCCWGTVCAGQGCTAVRQTQAGEGWHTPWAQISSQTNKVSSHHQKGEDGSSWNFRNNCSFFPLHHCRVLWAFSKSRTQPLTFFFSFSSYLWFFPLPHHLRQPKLWLTNSINILTVILSGKEAPAAFCSLQALPVPEELRVISR